MLSDRRSLLWGALLLLLVPIWIEPGGSWLGEPDEARYAEIPREMAAMRDFVTPHLNGVPYFEKPPLLYWANAASFSLFGETPWAARLPTRLAGLGTVLLIVWGAAVAYGLEAGLAAGILYLACPLGFAFSRLNLTDGLLTFFFAATLLSARRTLARAETAQSAWAWSGATGLAAAGAFLTKGLVGILLPGAILLTWCLATGRRRIAQALAFIPAALVFLATAAPWCVAAERRHPGFAQFFFVHEHVQRFATSSAHRSGPVYYFAGIFLAGFLPALPFFASTIVARPIRRWVREDADGLFFLIWFAVVFVFFSVSSSKLPPYLLPAIPAAAVLAGRGAGADAPARLWRLSALLAVSLVAGLALWPTARAWVREYSFTAIAIGGAVVLLLGALASMTLKPEGSPARALSALAAGWCGFYAALALAWPRVPPATELHQIEVQARLASESGRAEVVGYRSYLQGLPWELKRPVPVVDYVGELEPWFEQDPAVRDAIFWSRETFWSRWKAGRPLLAVVSRPDLPEFGASRVVFTSRKYSLVANF